MRLFLIFALAMAGAGPLAAAEPVPAKVATADFAKLATLEKPLLSPDGKRIAARATIDGEVHVVLLNADRPEDRPQRIALGKITVAALRWAGNQRLLLTLQGGGRVEERIVPFLRLIVIDTTTSRFRVVDKKSRGAFAGDVLYVEPAGAWALVSSQDDIISYPSVKRVDLATGEAKVVESARTDVWDWYSDDQGVVRAGLANQGRRWTMWYRDTAGEPLRKIKGKLDKDDDSSVDKVIFGRANNAWIMTNERTGRFGVYSYDLRTGATGETLFEHPEVDVRDVRYDPLTGKIAGIEYTDDRYRMHWLDPERKSLQANLDRALPGSMNAITDFSGDKKRVLVWSGTASDPGQYFLLDRSTAKMHPVVNPYDRIDPRHLAPVKAVKYQARDGLTLPAYLTLPRGRAPSGLPLIVLPHGGPFVRDDWSYDPLVQFLANRGYAVLQPQFRGSTGYGKDFVSRGYGEIGKRMQDDLDDGVDWLARSGQIDPKRVCVVGASYGGYASMWAATRNPERYRCAASWAGVSDLPAQLRYDRKLFSATRYFREWRTKVGGEGKTDLGAVSPLSHAGRTRVPLFIAHGENDQRVPVKQSRDMVEALTKAKADVTSAFYKDSGHDFGTAADFQDFLTRLEAFLAKHNPS